MKREWLDQARGLAEQLDALTIGMATTLVVVAVTFIWLMRREAGNAHGEMASLTPEALSEYGRPFTLAHAFELQTARLLPDGRRLMREHPEQVTDAWLERNVVHKICFEAGGWITGVALVFTFLLIALVLALDVGPAIENTTDVRLLSSAVRKMGAKFLISMLGILLTIAHGYFRSRWVSGLHAHASRTGATIAEHTVLLSDYRVELAEQTAREAQNVNRAVLSQHQELTSHLTGLTSAVKSLGSIEVSVRDIGTELSVRLQHVVKNDIVAGIRKDLEEVTDRLCNTLHESFAKTVQEELSGVRSELQKIESAVSSQAHGQVEQLLHKLGDAVSGGMATESSRMKQALERFVEVVPMLEQQMRTLIANAGDDLAKRGAENARASEALVGQLERVLSSIENQQSTSAALGEKMAAFVVQTEQTLSRSVADAQEEMTARSRVNLEELTSAVKSATGDATEVYRSLVREVESAAATLRDARTETAQTATHLGHSATSVKEIARYVNDSMVALRTVSESLAKNVEVAQSAAREGSETIRGSLAVVKQQQQFVEDLSGKWPELTRTYLDSTNQAFDRVAEEWKRCVTGIEQSVGRISNGFTESTTGFADAVEELGSHVQSLSRVLQGSAPRARTS